MEKLLYPFWHPNKGREQLRDELVQLLGPQLKREKGVHAVQINVSDEHFVPHEGSLQSLQRTQPGFQGMINIWIDTSFLRKPLEQRIRQHVAGFHGYSVVESQPIVNTTQPVKPGTRLDALSQLVFLEKPKHMEHQAWLNTWWNLHTQVAIDTQSTFQYVQNAVLRPLTPNAPTFHGIIEECFPKDAFISQEVFYDAVGDKQKLQANYQAMMDSCARFVDMAQMDLIFTSQYTV
jgi:hypothetical protein